MSILSKSMNKKALNSLMGKLLNGSYNIENLNDMFPIWIDDIMFKETQQQLSAGIIYFNIRMEKITLVMKIFFTML